MIPVDLLAKGFDFVTDKGLDWFKAIVGEVDKHRLIDYGEMKIATKNHQKLSELVSGGRSVKLRAQREGVSEDERYRRS